MSASGFLLHLVSDNPYCTKRCDGTYYGGGRSLTSALTVETLIRDKKAKYVDFLYGAGKKTFLSDLAITSCNWGATGQRDVLAKLAAALPSLYGTLQLRGVTIRPGPPSTCARAMGIENEGGFVYSSNPGFLTELTNGRNKIQAHLKTLSDGWVALSGWLAAVTVAVALRPASPRPAAGARSRACPR